MEKWSLSYLYEGTGSHQWRPAWVEVFSAFQLTHANPGAEITTVTTVCNKNRSRTMMSAGVQIDTGGELTLAPE